MTVKNISTTDKKRTITIQRTFDLPVATLWKAFSEPESFKKWWGPKEYTCPDCTIDFKLGGHFIASMQDEKGKKTWAKGIYKKIIPMKKIMYMDSFADSDGNIVPASYYDMPGDWDLELPVTIELEEMDGKTDMKLQHGNLPDEMADDCIKGWQSCLDKLEDL